MAVFKIDHTVTYCISEHRDEFVEAMKISGRMYNWHRDEDIESTVENFAIANPRATLGQMMDWTKKTHMERLSAHKGKTGFNNYKLDGPAIVNADPKPNTEGRRAVTMVDSIPARPKVRTDLKKVAEPGEEKDVDEADAVAAHEAEFGEMGDKPNTPDYNALKDLAPTDPNLARPDPVDPPYVPSTGAEAYAKAGGTVTAQDKPAAQSALAAKLAEMHKNK